MTAKHEKKISFLAGLTELAQSMDQTQFPDCLRTLHLKGIAQLSGLEIPTVKDEEWKYTNLKPLIRHTFNRPVDSKFDQSSKLNEYCKKDEITIVFVNGILSKELTNCGKLPKGVTLTTFCETPTRASAVSEFLKHFESQNKATFISLNDAFANTGTYIHVENKTIVEQLIHIVHVTGSNSQPAVITPKTFISIGSSSEATILESHVAFDDQLTYFSNAMTDIFLADNAVVHYCKSQKESLKAYHIGNTRVYLNRNANFDGFSFMAGGALTRNDLNIVLNGEGSNANLNALYSVYNDQHVDNHTSVDHRVPHCTSNQLYKGILNHNARAVFNGKVFVRDIAQQTNSYQLNQNLLMGKNCRVDTKPQLEIFADDVKCTHGATIGQLDEDQLFYLQTRSIPRRLAGKMLAHGFVDDLFNTIKNSSIHKKLNALMLPSFEAL